MTGCPFVWIASINTASPLQKRTSQLSPVNAGPAGSRPVECLDRIRECIKNRNLQQRNVYNNYDYYFYYFFLTGPAKRSRCCVCLRTGRSGDQNPMSVKFSAPAQKGPGSYPASCTIGILFLSRGKRTVVGLGHKPPSTAKSKKG
jgi:hypothetical protein